MQEQLLAKVCSDTCKDAGLLFCLSLLEKHLLDDSNIWATVRQWRVEVQGIPFARDSCASG